MFWHAGYFEGWLWMEWQVLQVLRNHCAFITSQKARITYWTSVLLLHSGESCRGLAKPASFGRHFIHKEPFLNPLLTQSGFWKKEIPWADERDPSDWGALETVSLHPQLWYREKVQPQTITNPNMYPGQSFPCTMIHNTPTNVHI